MAKISPQTIRSALEHGEIDLQGQFVLGSNYTFLVKVKYSGIEIPAVYKPMRGEQPLWDFPPASLAGREVAAWLVSESLGLGLVPITVLRDGPFGPGSLQEYIDHNPDLHYFNFSPADIQRLRPVALFDLLVNNADRKGGHILLQKRTHHIYLIDHGVCFHEEDKLRTVLWDFAGERIPVELIDCLKSFRGALEGDSELRASLEQFLIPSELVALEARSEALLRTPFFPAPPEDRRAYPYPML